MLSIFKKKLFADISGTAEDMPPHVSAVLCLMIEIARMDGKIDDNEIDEIKNFYLGFGCREEIASKIHQIPHAQYFQNQQK